MRSGGMGASIALTALGMGLLASAVLAATAPPADLLDHAALQQNVQEIKAGAYRATLSRYASALREHPRVSLAVARCRFIDGYTEENYGEWVESAPEDLQQCIQDLQQHWPDAPLARLFLFEQLWGAEAIEQGEALLPVAERWPKPLRRKLLAKLAQHYASDQQSGRAGGLALQAAQLGDVESVPRGVEHLLAQADQEGATELLRNSAIPDSEWQAGLRLQAAMQLDDPRVARRELQRHLDDHIDIAPAIVARIHLKVGEREQAIAALKDSKGGYEELRQLRFDIALAGADLDAALAEIQIDDSDDFPGLLQRFALLAHHSPQSLVRGAMLSAALLMLLILLALALAPGLLLVPVHYRGLLRRLRGRTALPLFATLGLRHAWVGAAVALCVPLIVALWLEPDSLAVLFSSDALPAARATFRIALWGTLCSLLLLSPWMVRLGRGGWLGDIPLRRQLRWAVLAWLLLFALGLLKRGWQYLQIIDPRGLHEQFIDQLVNGGSQHFGIPLAFLLLAMLIPLLEEFLFRGLLLGGMTQHIGFASANVLQALLFALAHDNWPRFPFYLGMGLLAGLLVKKSRGLGAPFALHAINNGLAFFVLLR